MKPREPLLLVSDSTTERLLLDAAHEALNKLSVFYDKRADRKRYLVNQAIRKLWECDRRKHFR